MALPRFALGLVAITACHNQGQVATAGADASPDASADVGSGPDAVAVTADAAPLLPVGIRWDGCGTLAAQITAVAHSPDGKLLALGRADGSVTVIRPSDGTKVTDLEGAPGSVDRLAFSADSQRLAVLGGRAVVLWGVGGTTFFRVLPTQVAHGRSLQFSGGAPPFVLVAGDGADGSNVVEVWGDDGAMVGTFSAAAPARFTGPGPSVLAGAEAGLAIYGFDGRQQQALPIQAPAMAFAPDGSAVAAVADDAGATTQRLWLASTTDGHVVWEVHANLPHPQIVLLADRVLAVSDQGLSVFARLDGAALGTFPAAAEAAIGADGVADPTPDGETIAFVGARDGRLMTLATRTGALAAAPGGAYGITGDVVAFDLTADGHSLAISGQGERTWIIDRDDGSLRHVIGAEGAFKPAFSRDGSLFALAGDARAVFRMSDGMLLVGLPPTTNVVGGYSWPALVFSADGQTLASGNEGQVELYALDGTARGVRPSRAHSPGVAFSADGRWMATSAPELWRVDDGTLVWKTSGSIIEPTDGMSVPDDTVTFSPDGTLLLVSNAWHPPSGDTWTVTTRLVKVADGSLVRDFGQTLGRRASFSRAGDWIAGGGALVNLARGDGPVTIDASLEVSLFLPDGSLVAAARHEPLVRRYCPHQPSMP